MDPLTLDDLLPLEEFAARRREFFAAHCRYLDRHRRVRIGPSASLSFENRQTLWFRVQEILRVARLADPVRVGQELDLYNRLLPGVNRLQAALVIDLRDESRLAEELAFWRYLQGEELRLVLGETRCPARLVTCRPEDRCIGAAHWVQFHLEPVSRTLLEDMRVPASVEIALPGYEHQGPLSEDVRQSLVEDLRSADRARRAG
jgi:hypothetical protein